MFGQLGIGTLGDGRLSLGSILLPLPLAQIYGANATSVDGGSAHSVFHTSFQKASIHEVVPRVGPASVYVLTRIWLLGVGFNSLRDH